MFFIIVGVLLAVLGIWAGDDEILVVWKCDEGSVG